MSGYDSWEQIAGYFDADETISLSDTTNQPYKLGLSLIFVDQSEDQIRNVQEFLRSEGVRTGSVLKMSKADASMVAVSEFDSVRVTSRRMLPFLYKKATEIQSALDYYDGKITGNEMFTSFQNEVDAGRRERRPRKVPIDVPYRYPEGDARMKALRIAHLKDALGRFRAKVTAGDSEAITRNRADGKSMRQLMKDYPQYSRTTIRRILGRGRDHVLVVREGVDDARVDEDVPRDAERRATAQA